MRSIAFINNRSEKPEMMATAKRNEKLRLGKVRIPEPRNSVMAMAESEPTIIRAMVTVSVDISVGMRVFFASDPIADVNELIKAPRIPESVIASQKDKGLFTR